MQTMTISPQTKKANYRQIFDRYDHMTSLCTAGSLRSEMDEVKRNSRVGQSPPLLD